MKKFILVSIIAFFFLVCCDKIVPDQYYGIDIRNNSSSLIIACGAYVLPDTLLPSEPLDISKIESGKLSGIRDSKINDPKLKRLAHERLTIFIISENVYNSTPWDTIREKNLILKKISFNWEEYKALGREVTYP